MSRKSFTISQLGLIFVESFCFVSSRSYLYHWEVLFYFYLAWSLKHGHWILLGFICFYELIISFPFYSANVRMVSIFSIKPTLYSWHKSNLVVICYTFKYVLEVSVVVFYINIFVYKIPAYNFSSLCLYNVIVFKFMLAF